MFLVVFLIIISIVMTGMYISATFMTDEPKNDFTKSVIDKQSVVKKIDWMNKISNLKDSFFNYPTQEVSLEFNSFNATKSNEREYSIFSINLNTQKYDFECIRILLDDKNIIYSFLKNELDVRIDLIVNDLTNKNYIQSYTKNCLFKKDTN